MQPGGVNDWVAASLNRPLTTADRVWTDKNSKAELNVGDGFLRMNSETSVTLTNVSDNTVQVELDQGTLEVTVRHLEKGEIYEVDTPNYAFTVMKTGVYRFDVYPNEDESWVTVRSGYGEATGKGPGGPGQLRPAGPLQQRQTLQHTADERSRPRWLRRLGAGARQAAGRFRLRALRLARRDRLSGPRRLRHLADGRRPTARSGFRPRCPRAGRLIATDIGRGSLPGAGPGLMTRPGASLPSTTAAGCLGMAVGAGLLDRSATGILTMLRHWSAGLADPASALASDLGGGGWVSASTSAGSRWAGVQPYYPRYCGWGHGGWYRGGGW